MVDELQHPDRRVGGLCGAWRLPLPQAAPEPGGGGRAPAGRTAFGRRMTLEVEPNRGEEPVVAVDVVAGDGDVVTRLGPGQLD